MLTEKMITKTMCMIKQKWKIWWFVMDNYTHRYFYMAYEYRWHMVTIFGKVQIYRQGMGTQRANNWKMLFVFVCWKLFVAYNIKHCYRDYLMKNPRKTGSKSFDLGIFITKKNGNESIGPLNGINW
jgi:hypothetical protein